MSGAIQAPYPPYLPMQRVLLTGASGFIGYHLIRRLHREGCEVRCLLRPTSKPYFPDLSERDICYGDLNDIGSLETAVQGCDTVFHLAGRVRADSFKAFLEANRHGTSNLALAASRLSNPPVFVFASSLAAMGPSTTRPKVETDYPVPVSEYGRSKLAAERAILKFSHCMPCSIARPSIVFGEADKMNLELFKTIKRIKICPIPGWLDKEYSWIHAEDLCELLVRIARSGERLTPESLADDSQSCGKGIYLASDGGGRKMSDIGREIGRSLGLKKTIALRCPPLAVLAVSGFYETRKRITGKDQPYDLAKAFESLKNWTGSPQKAELQLGFKPLAPFSKRMEQTSQWYAENRWL